MEGCMHYADIMLVFFQHTYMILTFSMLQATEADVKVGYFSLLFLETELDISFKLSPQETIWMKCQTLFSSEYNKNIRRCRLPELKVSMAKVKDNLWKT